MPDPAPFIRLGTRGSPLALRQAEDVKARLCAAHGLEPSAIAICIIKTSGDQILDRTLSEVGGKGLFTKEIEEALLAGTIDVAVHSAKDVPTYLPEGLIISTYLERQDVRDAYLSHRSASLAELRPGSTVGTASLRRQAQVLRARPDLRVVPLRGNVQTRVSKLAGEEIDATLLALAGLNRLGCADIATSLLPLDQFLPAIGQGAVALEIRASDERTRERVAPLNHRETATAVTAERAFLTVLDGSCRTPIAGLGLLDRDNLYFRGEVLRPDGSEFRFGEMRGSASDAAAIGEDVAQKIKRELPGGFITAL